MTNPPILPADLTEEDVASLVALADELETIVAEAQQQRDQAATDFSDLIAETHQELDAIAAALPPD